MSKKFQRTFTIRMNQKTLVENIVKLLSVRMATMVEGMHEDIERILRQEIYELSKKKSKEFQEINDIEVKDSQIVGKVAEINSKKYKTLILDGVPVWVEVDDE